MSHTSREKRDLTTRTKKGIGQLESVLRGLNDDEQCSEILRRLAAARGAINSLMGELMEDHIINHMPKNSKSAEEAAEDMIQIVRTYLKKSVHAPWPTRLPAKRMQSVLLKFLRQGQQCARVPGSSRPVYEIPVLLEFCNFPKPLRSVLVRDSHHIGKVTRS